MEPLTAVKKLLVTAQPSYRQNQGENIIDTGDFIDNESKFGHCSCNCFLFV